MDSISQSDAEWRIQRDFLDAEITANTIRAYATKKGREEGLKKGLEQGRKQGLEQGLKQGIEQGLEQGREEGRSEKTVEAAKSFYANGVSVEIIAKSLNIPVEQIIEIVNG